MFRFRDGNTAERILRNIKALDVDCKLMHICGTHQDTMVRFGLEELLGSAGVEIRQGPGCPVCVTTGAELAAGITMARSGITVCVFGDMMKVPTSAGSLDDAKADGADVRVVYSVEDAVRMASSQKEDLVFMAVGFETTASTTAVPLNRGVPENFSVYSCHRIVPPVLEMIFEMGEIKVDGLIQPGHVAVITGLGIFEPFSKKYKIPQAIAGFEPLDLLVASYMLAKQIKEGRAEVKNEYSRLVRQNGNLKAQELISNTFTAVDRAWRGFQVIPQSALAPRKEFESHDAAKVHEDILENVPDVEEESKGCRCGEVLRGLIRSEECPAFGKTCDPSRPMGPCMVSHEGSCNIAFRFNGRNGEG